MAAAAIVCFAATLRSCSAAAAEPNDGAPAADAAALVELKFPAAVDEVAVGGSGRYLILWLGRVRQLAIVDVAARTIAKYLPVDDDQIVFAAGETKLVVGQTGKGIVSRYDLRTARRETTQIESLGIRTLAMGCASEGPIYAATGEDFRQPLFLDLATFRPLRIGMPNARDFANNVRVSAEGNLIGGWSSRVSPSGLHSLVLKSSTAIYYNEHRSVGLVLPAADGSRFFTSAGRYTPEAKALDDDDLRREYRTIYLPSATGPLLLAVSSSDRPDRPVRGGVQLLLQSDLSLISELRDIEPPIGEQRWNAMPLDKRLHLLPAADAIVRIPTSGDKLEIHRFRLSEQLAKRELNYLFVNSRPSTPAVRGATYRYQIETWSKGGGVRYRCDAGPEGLKVDEQGMVTWPVPPAQELGEQVVIIGIGDASREEIFHTFRLRVQPEVVGDGRSADVGLPTTSASPKPRTWTSDDGLFVMSGTLIEASETAVRLRLTDGTTSTVPVARLSEADRKFLAEKRPPMDAK